MSKILTNLCCSLAALLLLSSCALPVPEGKELGTFIPTSEIVSVRLLEEGMNYYNESRFVDAELRFRQALFLNPDLTNVKFNLAATLEKEGLYAEAQQLYTELLAKEPDYVLYISALARLAFTRHAFTEAAEYYKHTIDAAIKNNDNLTLEAAYRSLSVVGFRAGDEQSAWCYSLLAQQLAPTKDESLKHARMLLALGRTREALDLLTFFAAQNALDKDPDFLHLRAVASYGLGNFADALTFENAGRFLSNVDPNLQFEMQLVRLLAAQRLEPDKKFEDIIEDDGGKSEFIDSMLAFERVSQSSFLYWPANLLADLEDKVKENS